MVALNFWDSVAKAAISEARDSPLPGLGNGPADAYRHLVLAEELRRRFGFIIASTLLVGMKDLAPTNAMLHRWIATWTSTTIGWASRLGGPLGLTKTWCEPRAPTGRRHL